MINWRCNKKLRGLEQSKKKLVSAIMRYRKREADFLKRIDELEGSSNHFKNKSDLLRREIFIIKENNLSTESSTSSFKDFISNRGEICNYCEEPTGITSMYKHNRGVICTCDWKEKKAEEYLKVNLEKFLFFLKAEGILVENELKRQDFNTLYSVWSGTDSDEKLDLPFK